MTKLIWCSFSVPDRVDSLADRQKTFFVNCSRKLKAGDRDEEYKKIKAEYEKVVEDANEKVQIAEDCYGLVDRYLRKLDAELHKFKCELEADNRGITEILEKQSLEMDSVPSTSNPLKENRQPKKHKKQSSVDYTAFSASAGSSFDPSLAGQSGSSGSTSFSPNFGHLTASGQAVAGSASPTTSAGSNPASTLSLQHIGVGGNAIAAAASQVILPYFIWTIFNL